MKVLYIDLDNTLVDFQSGIDRLDEAARVEYHDRYDDAPGIFALMDPMSGAIDAYHQLSAVFDTYILSTAPWDNPSAWSDKLLWVKKHLGDGVDSPAYKRVILSHHKNLNTGDFIIDDRTARGVDLWDRARHIHFGQPGFETWDRVVEHLIPLAADG